MNVDARLVVNLSVLRNNMTENEFALKVIPLIGGAIIPDRYKIIAEVPRGSHQNHADLLVIKPDRKF